MPDPADILHRAADRVEALAAQALTMPDGWDETSPTWHASCDIVTDDNNQAVAVTYGPARWPQRDWIATLCPAVSTHLAAMLRAAAKPGGDLSRAVSLARVILKEAQ